MNKRIISAVGKGLFISGFVVLVLGYGWLLPGISFGLILLSFVFLAFGSRVGDEQN